MTLAPQNICTHFTLPLEGGGTGWGWCRTFDVVDTPLPNPPPQGGREGFGALTRPELPARGGA